MSHLKKYTYGKLSLERFLNTLRKVLSQSAFNLVEKNGADERVRVWPIERDKQIVEESGRFGEGPKYAVELDGFNWVDLDLSANRVSVFCDNEELRVKVKDALLKCLKTL